MQLSPNFHLDELIASEYAVRNNIRNDPLPRALANLQRLCNDILEPLRAQIGKAIIVTSGYRSHALNKAIGGSETPPSEHCDGRAADIIIPGMKVMDVCLEVIRLNLPFNQCINEFGRWTHVSINAINEDPRRQLLTAKKDTEGRTFYLRGLV